VTVEEDFFAVSLLRECGLGKLILGPARCAAAPPPNPSGARDSRRGASGAQCVNGLQEVKLPRPSGRSLPARGEVRGGMLGVRCRRARPPPLPHVSELATTRGYGAQATGCIPGGAAATYPRDATGQGVGRAALRGAMVTLRDPRVEKARVNEATRTTAAPTSAGGIERPPLPRKFAAPVEPIAGVKSADPGRPAGAPYRGPRDERDPASVVVVSALTGVRR